MKNKISNFHKLFNFQRKFIASGASFQTDSSKVKIRGKFLKSQSPDMPTLLFFPEALKEAHTYEKFFTNPNHDILKYRNVWILNPRNFGDSDHHESFCLNDCAEDIKRFIDEKQLSIVTVGGHGFGAKVACAFSTMYLDNTSGVICIEGGPIDQSYHPAWNSIKEYIQKAYLIGKETSNYSDVVRKLEKSIPDKDWLEIIKSNLIDTSSGISWKCNMEGLYWNSRRRFSDLTKFNSMFGLFPGRALVQWASHSHHIHLATNTMPFYNFFPKLEGKFPTTTMNIITTEEDENSKFFN